MKTCRILGLSFRVSNELTKTSTRSRTQFGDQLPIHFYSAPGFMVKVDGESHLPVLSLASIRALMYRVWKKVFVRVTRCFLAWCVRRLFPHPYISVAIEQKTRSWQCRTVRLHLERSNLLYDSYQTVPLSFIFEGLGVLDINSISFS